MRYLRLVLAALLSGALLVACTPDSDKVAPTATLTAPTDGAEVVLGAEVTVAGTAADNIGVARVEVRVNGSDVRGASGTTAWSYGWVPADAGEYTLQATAYDAAGNSGASGTVTVTVVAEEPVPTSGSVGGIITRTEPAPGPDLGGDAAFRSDSQLLQGNGSSVDLHADAAPVVPGEVFVVFKQGRPQPVLGTTGSGDATLGAFTFSPNGDFTFRGAAFQQARAYPLGTGLALYRTDVTSQRATLDLVESLRAQDLVQEAFPNWILSAQQVYPEDPGAEFQAWHYEQLNLPEAWEIETGASTRVTVAVLDSGRFDHPDIAWAEPGANLVNWACVEGVCAPDSSEGLIDNPYTNVGNSTHGTHVAGTIGALTNNEDGVAGINWNVDIVPVKVLGGPGGSGTLNGIIEGMFWAAGVPDPAYGGHDNPNPAWVMNLSLGGNILEACPAAIDSYIGLFAEFGTLTVVSAGNNASPSDVYFPANCASAITVGATGPTGARAYYSNYGPYVDVMAPGGDSDYENPSWPGRAAGVLSTVADDDWLPNYGLMEGTSMAAPHVTGVVSLMLAADPNLTLDEVRERLHNASVPLSSVQCSVPTLGLDGYNACGAGLLDAAAALLGATVTTPTATAYAIPYDGENAPVIGLGDVFSLERLATNKVEATALPNGDFEFEFSELAPGSYLIVGLELRAATTGVSNADRVGFVEDVVVEAGGSEEVTVVVTPIYQALR